MSSSQPATKADLQNLETKITKNIDKKFDQFGELIIGAIDQLKDDVFSELRTIKNDIKEIKKRLTALENRTIEDSNAYAKEIVKLRDQVSSLHKRVKTLEKQQA